MDGRAGVLGLLLKTTNRSAFRKAASPVAIALRKKNVNSFEIGWLEFVSFF